MNQDEIIEMAHRASPDLTWYAATEDPNEASPDELDFLMRFAKLVAAKEREACAKVAESFGKYESDLAEAIRARGEP